MGNLFEYAAFFLMAATLASVLHLRRRFDVVQVNSLPDTLVFAALIPRLMGARVLLDLHECMPEFFATRFGKAMNHPLIRFIVWLEQASIRFADFVITCTDQMREAFIARGAPANNIEVIFNGADEDIFRPRSNGSRRGADDFVLICHGTVEERYGLDTAIRAVALLRDDIPGLRLEIYGEGASLPELRRLSKELGTEDHVYFSGKWVPLDELLRAISEADVGIVPTKRDIFRDLTLCNKMYEFIAMHKPVVASRTRAVEAYYDASCFRLFAADDEHELAGAIQDLYRDPALRERLAQRAAEVNQPFRWTRQQELYRGIVDGLLADPRKG